MSDGVVLRTLQDGERQSVPRDGEHPGVEASDQPANRLLHPKAVAFDA